MPDWLYLVAVAIYLVFFGLFVRFFLWKAYAERTYWRRRPALDLRMLEEAARRRGKELPFISVVVPARNEADVIGRTIDHMCGLTYPPSRYEVVVVTDGKERMARDETRPSALEAARATLLGAPEPPRGGEQGRLLVLGLLVRLAQEWWQARAAAGPARQPGAAAGGNPGALPVLLDAREERALVREMAWSIVQHRGSVRPRHLLFLARRAYNGWGLEVARRAYPFYLGAAVPVVLAYLRLTGQPLRPVWLRLCHVVLPARGPLAREKVLALAAPVARRLVRQVVACRRTGQLSALLEEVFPECFPTTGDVVRARVAALADRLVPRVREVEVPYDFDGRVEGACTGHPVPSTKGRALNYALSYLDPAAVMCAFYDAESRPDPRVLMYVAYRWLTDENPPAIYQGPVFQVRNFYQMGPVCKVAALYQAVAHDWYLPVLFRRLPFVGGTNLVVDRRLLESIGGFDPACLTEDLELGVRAYLEADVWPVYLPYASSEQTPPTVRAFFRQRLRWGTGHLLVMDKVRSGSHYDRQKKERLLRTLFLKGQVEWTLYQTATFVPPIFLVLFLTGNLDVTVVPAAIRHALNVMSLTYAAFTFYTYRRYSPYLDTWCRPDRWAGRVWVWLQLLILPLVAFLFPTPYSTALVLKKLGRHPRMWTKTPRTRE
ncbi:MAG: glycosyltransferase [Bacillota bacterium]|nr:glycosyltransferase [Bacillota bacterium]MDI7250083.1 glycosyltransferase [Bacillota bacterium]